MLMTVYTDVEYKRKKSLQGVSMMPPPTFCFNFPQHLEEQKRAFDHGKSCLITAMLAHYGWGGGWFRNPDAQKRKTEEKKHGGRNKREKDTDRPVPVSQSETAVKSKRIFTCNPVLHPV